MSDIIDLMAVYTYYGSVYIDNSEVFGTSLRTLFSNGSEMRSWLRVFPLNERVDGKYPIVRRFFNVHSTARNDQPLPKYEVIFSLLDKDGKEAGPQYQTRFGSGHPSTDLEVAEQAVVRLHGDSGRICYRVEIRSLEMNLTKASATIDAEKKMASKLVPPNSIQLEKPAKIIAKLLNNNDLYSDVVVACGEGLRMKAHKNILCAHSETFRLAFSQKNAVEGRNGVYTISEDHMRPETVRLLLEWMYLQAGLGKTRFF
jgi:hypothetical protein